MDKLDADYISHYGVKGMKWGRRRADRSPTPVDTVATPGKRIKTKGGKNLPASDDAIVAAVGRQIAKSSGVHALSNKELRTVVDRMNLEQQYSRLAGSGQASLGQKFIKDLVTNPNKRDEFIKTGKGVIDIIKKAQSS